MAGVEHVQWTVKCPKCERTGELVIEEDENPVFGRDPIIHSLPKGFKRAAKYDRKNHLGVACRKCGVEAKYYGSSN